MICNDNNVGQEAIALLITRTSPAQILPAQTRKRDFPDASAGDLCAASRRAAPAGSIAGSTRGVNFPLGVVNGVDRAGLL
jgi:hypothetical protein